MSPTHHLHAISATQNHHQITPTQCSYTYHYVTPPYTTTTHTTVTLFIQTLSPHHTLHDLSLTPTLLLHIQPTIHQLFNLNYIRTTIKLLNHTPSPSHLLPQIKKNYHSTTQNHQHTPTHIPPTHHLSVSHYHYSPHTTITSLLHTLPAHYSTTHYHLGTPLHTTTTPFHHTLLPQQYITH